VKKWLALAAVAAVFVWGFSGSSRSEESRQKASRPLTAAQVMERSAQIARTVVPDGGEMEMHAEQFGVKGPVWDVRCVDLSGRPRLTLQIDGKTGDVFQLTVIPRRLDLSGPARMSKADAADAARRWLAAVRPLGHVSLNAVDAWPVRLGWMVRFEGNGTRSFATVDAKTGALHGMSSGRREYQEALGRHVTRI
jgi:hypothetical protein